LRMLSQRVSCARRTDSWSAPPAVVSITSRRTLPLGWKTSSGASSGLAMAQVPCEAAMPSCDYGPSAGATQVASWPAITSRQTSRPQKQAARLAALLVRAGNLVALGTAAEPLLAVLARVWTLRHEASPRGIDGCG